MPKIVTSGFSALFALALILIMGAMPGAVLHAATLRFVSGAALPTSIGSPTTDDGVSLLTRSVIVHTLVLTNTGASDYTFRIHDCQVTPYQLVKDDFTITAGSNIVWNFGTGIKFVGCFKWVASNAAVQGSISLE